MKLNTINWVINWDWYLQAENQFHELLIGVCAISINRIWYRWWKYQSHQCDWATSAIRENSRHRLDSLGIIDIRRKVESTLAKNTNGMKNGNQFFEHSSEREGGRHDDYRSAAEREARRRGAGCRCRSGPERRGSGRAIGGHRDSHLGILHQSWRWVIAWRAWSVLLIKAHFTHTWLISWLCRLLNIFRDLMWSIVVYCDRVVGRSLTLSFVTLSLLTSLREFFWSYHGTRGNIIASNL